MNMKLFKHEFVRTRLPLMIIAACALGLALLISLISFFSVTVSLIFLYYLFSFYIGAQAIYLMIDFYRSAFGSKQATLTHTLPLSGATIYFTKIVYMIVVQIVSILAAIVLAAGYLLITGQALQDELGVSPLIYTADVELIDAVGNFMLFMLITSIGSVIIGPAVSASVMAFGGNGALGRLGVAGPIISYAVYTFGFGLIATVLCFMPPLYDAFTGQILFENIISYGIESAQMNAAHNYETAVSGIFVIPLAPLFIYLVMGIIAVTYVPYMINQKLDLSAK